MRRTGISSFCTCTEEGHKRPCAQTRMYVCRLKLAGKLKCLDVFFVKLFSIKLYRDQFRLFFCLILRTSKLSSFNRDAKALKN
jgi:hypothetical protein